MNIATLLNYDRQIKGSADNVISYLLKDRVEEFYGKYNAKIFIVQTHIHELQKKYFVFEGERIKVSTLNGKQERIMLLGKTKDGYNKELMDILNTPVET